jgi:hypothetical protein
MFCLKGDAVKMRKILLGLVITGFALVLFITIKPQTAFLTINPEKPATNTADEQISLEPAAYFTVVQGGSEQALTVRNNCGETISFSLGHEHAYLTFQPQGDRLPPGVAREVMIQVDPKCPVGDIALPVYLRTEIDGERTGMETVVLLNVIPGMMTLESIDGRLYVLWNGGPAPRGVLVDYRIPGESEWRLWGETPRIDPPLHLAPGTYSFEFKARLGDVESAAEVLEIFVEEIIEAKEPEPETSPSTGSSSAPKEKTEEVVEPDPEPPKIGTMEYLIWKKQQKAKAEEEAKKAAEEPPSWWEME